MVHQRQATGLTLCCLHDLWGLHDEADLAIKEKNYEVAEVMHRQGMMNASDSGEEYIATTL